MSSIEPIENHKCPNCDIKLTPSGFDKYKCKKCGHIDKKEYDDTLMKMFGIGG